MNNNLSEFRNVSIYIDEKNNIAVFSKSKNPNYNNEIETPMYLTSKIPLELKYPYSLEELAELIKNGIHAWDKYEPYLNTTKSIEEHYYDVNGFRKATYKKKLLSLGWDDIEGKYISLYLPLKTGKYYMGIKSTKLSDDADWLDFAHAVMEYINMDITKLSAFQTYKSKLNL